MDSNTIYTSYFNNPLLKGLAVPKYSIALKTYCTTIPRVNELLLPPSLFNHYKRGLIDLDSLKHFYIIEVLEFLDASSIFLDYAGSIFLCHEKRGCHREALVEWLCENGYYAKELTIDDLREE